MAYCIAFVEYVCPLKFEMHRINTLDSTPNEVHIKILNKCWTDS